MSTKDTARGFATALRTDAHVNFGGSIITDAAAKKQQGVAGATAGLIMLHKYHAKRYEEKAIVIQQHESDF